MDWILDRRSVRNFKTDPIADEVLADLVKAGMYAPSARGTRPWHFIILTQREQLTKLQNAHPYAKMLEQAPACIMVCGDRALEGAEDFYLEDCAAATENILLKAREQDIASCWLGVRPKELENKAMYRALFALPETIEPFCFIALGYPEGPWPQRPERVDQEKIHWNQW